MLRWAAPPPKPNPPQGVAAIYRCMQTCCWCQTVKGQCKMISRSYDACRLHFQRLNCADPHEQHHVQPRDNPMLVSPLPPHPRSHPHRPLKTPPQPPPRLPIQKATTKIRMSLNPRAVSLWVLMGSLSKLASCRLVMKTMVHGFSRPALQSKHMLRALRTLHHRMHVLLQLWGIQIPS